MADGVGSGRSGYAGQGNRGAPPERGNRLDDAHYGRGNLPRRRRRWSDAPRPKQALPPRRGVRCPADDPGNRARAGLCHRHPETDRVSVRSPRAGAEVVMAVTEAYELREVLLHAEKIYLRFGDNLVLRDVDLKVQNIVRPTRTATGQVIGLLGPSGMGKTQLFRILAGLNQPDTGTVLIGPKQVPVTPGMVGVVAQHYPLFRHRTVLGNLIVAGVQAGMSRREARDKTFELLKR